MWKSGFRFLFNAQFFGTDVASLLPGELTYTSFVGAFITAMVSAWIIAYTWAWLYNRLANALGGEE